MILRAALAQVRHTPPVAAIPPLQAIAAGRLVAAHHGTAAGARCLRDAGVPLQIALMVLLRRLPRAEVRHG